MKHHTPPTPALSASSDRLYEYKGTHWLQDTAEYHPSAPLNAARDHPRIEMDYKVKVAEHVLVLDEIPEVDSVVCA